MKNLEFDAPNAPIKLSEEILNIVGSHLTKVESIKMKQTSSDTVTTVHRHLGK